MSFEGAADGFALLAIGLLLHIAWYDFYYLKIRNVSVLALLGVYAIWAFLGGFQTLAADIGAGVILFSVGLLMWRAKMMGGGDVKLYFGLGLFMGIAHLGLFAIALLLATALFLVALAIAARVKTTAAFATRLREIRNSGKAPYAVPMCLAAIPVIVLRVYVGGS